MTDWVQAYANHGHHDRDDVRERTSIELVLSEELGLTFDEFGSALCPFHADSNPSFRVFVSDDGKERAGCWSCEWRGDVFDVIRAVRSELSFGEAVQYLARQYAGLARPKRAAAGTAPLPQPVLQAASRAAWSRAAGDMGPLSRFVAAKELHVPADFLFREFFVGVGTYIGAGTIHIPHLDPDRRVVGFKTRTAATPTIAAPGSKFSELYGVWRDPGHGPLLVMEGESDTWSAAWLAGDRAAVVGLPTGTNTPIRAHWHARFAGREVITIFDPDQQGMDAAVRWTDQVGADAVFLGKGVKDFSKMSLEQQKNCLDTVLVPVVS